MSRKIAFIGAGSFGFTRALVRDILSFPAFSDATIALMDIDPERLDAIYRACKRIAEEGKYPATIIATQDRVEALKGADGVVTTILQGGCDVWQHDILIPKKYGVDTNVGDTRGPSGIFRYLRTINPILDIAGDIMKYCPNAVYLNYTNPMAMLAGYMQRYTPIKTVGLCHSVQVCSRGILNALGIEYKEPIKERIAGINHMAWLLEIEDADGNDLYPEIRRRAIATLEEELAKGDSKHGDLVRYEYIRRLGYYCTESSEHNSEYNAFFIKSKYPELIQKYNIPLDEYPRRCVNQIAGWKNDREKYIKGDVSHNRSREYASYIMEAMVTDNAYKIGGNVINNGLISNLPAEACVEVACLVNKYGIQPTQQPPLPVQLAAMNMTNINAQLLTIEAAVTKKKEYIYQAAMMDPHTSSELSIDDIVALCDDLIEAHKGWLPEYH